MAGLIFPSLTAVTVAKPPPTARRTAEAPVCWTLITRPLVVTKVMERSVNSFPLAPNVEARAVKVSFKFKRMLVPPEETATELTGSRSKGPLVSL